MELQLAVLGIADLVGDAHPDRLAALAPRGQLVALGDHHVAAVATAPVEMRAGQRVIALDDATLRFTEAADGRGEGLGGLDLACADPGRAGLVQICGIRFRLGRS